MGAMGARAEALEQAARLCETMIQGGRAMSPEQAAATEALLAAAKAIRALHGVDFKGPKVGPFSHHEGRRWGELRAVLSSVVGGFIERRDKDYEGAQRFLDAEAAALADRLEPVNDNLRQAMQNTVEAKVTETEVRLATYVLAMLDGLNDGEARARAYEESVDIPPRNVDDTLVARLADAEERAAETLRQLEEASVIVATHLGPLHNCASILSPPLETIRNNVKTAVRVWQADRRRLDDLDRRVRALGFDDEAVVQMEQLKKRVAENEADLGKLADLAVELAGVDGTPPQVVEDGLRALAAKLKDEGSWKTEAFNRRVEALTLRRAAEAARRELDALGASTAAQDLAAVIDPAWSSHAPTDTVETLASLAVAHAKNTDMLRRARRAAEELLEALKSEGT